MFKKANEKLAEAKPAIELEEKLDLEDDCSRSLDSFSEEEAKIDSVTIDQKADQPTSVKMTIDVPVKPEVAQATIKTEEKPKEAAIVTPQVENKASVPASKPAVKPANNVSPPKGSLDMWTEKHTPKQLREVAGNNGLINKVLAWLSNWTPASNPKSLLISGPPGIGKTTTVRLIGQKLGYSAQELNASDIRNKESVENRLRDASDNCGISGFNTCAKAMIIMDEIDGMSGGDKGGIAALIEVIKRTKIPIVCICNDRSCPKLKSLGKYCGDMRFQKPTAKDVVMRLVQICKSENFPVPVERLNLIALTSGLDLRQSVNMLQLFYRNSSWAFALNSQKDKCVLVNKFQALTNLLTLEKLKQTDKMNLFFVDPDFVPMLVQENYLSTMGSLDGMALAADSIAFSDTVQTVIKSQNEWSLLPVFGQHSTIEPVAYANLPPESINFPEILGKISVQRKVARLKSEVRDCIAPVAHISEEESISEYANLLTCQFVTMLKTREKDAIPDITTLLETYGLTLDLMKNNCLELSHKSVTSEFKSIPQPVKTALTKAFSKKHKSTPSEKPTVKGSESEESDSEEVEDVRI